MIDYRIKPEIIDLTFHYMPQFKSSSGWVNLSSTPFLLICDAQAEIDECKTDDEERGLI